jgi:agmatine deiminase
MIHLLWRNPLALARATEEVRRVVTDPRQPTPEQMGQLDYVEACAHETMRLKPQRLPASYANFYIANQVILLPCFNDPNDAVATRILQECFPDRRIAGIDCRDLVWGLGAFHCLTQQVPDISR